MSLSIMHARNNERLSWQDRTINTEVMMAPLRAQLLYNKHKGLNTKCRQESSNIEREKISYLRSYRTEIRLMEMRKNTYTRRRNDIQVRKKSAESRRPGSSFASGGRKSAPPRLERDESKVDNSDTFLTQLGPRCAKSAEPTINAEPFRNFHRQVPNTSAGKSKPSSGTRDNLGTPCWTTPTPVMGKPYLKLERQKSVRFQSANGTFLKEDVVDNDNNNNVEIPLEDRINNFMKAQSAFNKRELEARSYSDGGATKGRESRSSSGATQRRGSVQSTSLVKLENAFNNFCIDRTPDGFSKLVKYASKMKVNLKNTRSMSIIPVV